MDSPLLPTLRGGSIRDLDQSVGDLTLASDGSPAPLRSQPGFALPSRAVGGVAGSLFSLPPPTRHFDETPDAPPRVLSKGSNASASGTAGGEGIKPKPRFSLFAPQSSTQKSSLIKSTTSSGTLEEDEEEVVEEKAGKEEVEGEGDQTIIAGQGEPIEENRGARDERLRESLYELRNINDTFEMFLGALESARGHNERLAARVRETSMLLDQYTLLLGQTEHTYKLLSNPAWTGGIDDARNWEAEQIAKEEAEAEARRKAREAERLAEEEKERQAEAARAKEAAAASTSATRGAVRGRGAPPGRGGATRGRGSGIPAPTQRAVSGGKGAPTVRKAPEGLGLAGQYANVKSSGYGPSRKAT